MRKLVGCLILSMGMFAAAANADSPRLYYGVGFSDGSIEVNGAEDRSLGTLNVTVGLRLLKFLGIEFAGGVASDHTDSIFTEPLVSYQAAMLRLGWQWDRFGLYVLGGQAALDVDSSLNFTDGGNALGMGVNLFGNESTSLNLHFLRLDEGAFTTATIGFQHYFGGFR